MSGDKAALRRKMRALREELPQAARKVLSQKAAGHVLSWTVTKEADAVFLYDSMGAELITHGLIEALLRRGKTVCLPRIAGAGRMEAVSVASRNQLVPGPFGTREPPAHLPAFAPEKLSLVLAPGLAFTNKGVRLGYGGGYYDRFLQETAAVRVGLCFSIQIVDELPRAVYDKDMQFLITENGLTACGEAYI